MIDRRGPLRIACEQAVLEVAERAKSRLWTLRQLRDALRAARRAQMLRWRGARAKAVGRAWYAAVRAICGARVTKLPHPKQLPLPIKESTP